jgi:hypothetical protein
VESYHKPFPPQIIQGLLIDKLLPFYKQREMERIRYVATKPQNLAVSEGRVPDGLTLQGTIWLQKNLLPHIFYNKYVFYIS